MDIYDHISLNSSYNDNNFSHKSCRKNQNTHFTFNNIFFRKSWRFEVTWKNAVQPDRPQMAIRRKRATCWLPKTTNTHSEYVIIIAFPLQQWLQERASLLLYTILQALFFFFYKSNKFCFKLLVNAELP
jgi:hypothetical protein